MKFLYSFYSDYMPYTTNGAGGSSILYYQNNSQTVAKALGVNEEIFGIKSPAGYQMVDRSANSALVQFWGSDVAWLSR